MSACQEDKLNDEEQRLPKIRSRDSPEILAGEKSSQGREIPCFVYFFLSSIFPFLSFSSFFLFLLFFLSSVFFFFFSFFYSFFLPFIFSFVLSFFNERVLLTVRAVVKVLEGPLLYARATAAQQEEPSPCLLRSTACDGKELLLTANISQRGSCDTLWRQRKRGLRSCMSVAKWGWQVYSVMMARRRIVAAVVELSVVGHSLLLSFNRR